MRKSAAGILAEERGPGEQNGTSKWANKTSENLKALALFMDFLGIGLQTPLVCHALAVCYAVDPTLQQKGFPGCGGVQKQL